jgi:aspartyl protease family protein
MRNILLIGAFVGASASVPILYQASPSAFHDLVAPRQTSVPAPAASPLPAPPAATAPGGRRLAIEADRDGHFRVELRFNGRKVDGLIDTGATLVAMNETTARRSGIAITRSDFTHEVNTANGTTRAAIVRIDTLEIGRIRVGGIDALVLEDKALGTTLIGMNVLKKLARFEVKDDVLLLEQ